MLQSDGFMYSRLKENTSTAYHNSGKRQTQVTQDSDELILFHSVSFSSTTLVDAAAAHYFAESLSLTFSSTLSRNPLAYEL
jgi:hypothetical protein